MKKTLLLFAICLFVQLGYSQNDVQKLFNGKDMTGWNFIVEGNKAPVEEVFSVKDGVIQIKGTPFGYMYTQKKYRNYHLHVEWRWDGKSTNSGIFLQIVEPKNPFPNGIECQLHAGDAGDFVLLGGSDLEEYKLSKNGIRPAFPVIKKQKESSEKEAGEWNSADIYVYNGVITVYINGVFQNIGTNLVKEGCIGLQSEGGPIQFRNVILFEIK